MALNITLQKAESKKRDEFYTQRTNIENELRHYKEHFRGKIVYCNCDDPKVSNFFDYFSSNFAHLGLKQLIATCYKNREPDMFSRDERHLNIRAFTPAMRLKVYEGQNGICAACGKPFRIEEMDADHIIPWSRGGKTEDANCQMLCRPCNASKGGK